MSRRTRAAARPCRVCGNRLHPLLACPPPAGLGQGVHPLCDVGGNWWTDADYAAVDAMRTTAPTIPDPSADVPRIG